MPSIAIYPYNDKQSATAFLLSLHAKGYHPRVVVTDLRVDYGPLMAQVFPKATHHECIFHALRQAHRHLRAVYRAAEERAHPDIDALREAVDALWDTPCKRTAQRRYDNLNRFLVTGGKRQIGCAGLAYSVVLRYDLLPLPGWDSTWMIAKGVACCSNGLQRQG